MMEKVRLLLLTRDWQQRDVYKRQPAAGAGAVKVTASVPGKVVKVAASVGQAVKAGDSVVILESMKMEIPVVAPQDLSLIHILSGG